MVDGLPNERVHAIVHHTVGVGVYENSITEGSL
jgi:hypothetical protein